MFGFLNIYKPLGMTSHDVVNRLRRILHIKKIGHGGTLDPMAEGVLPVAVSGATRLIDFLPQEKEYLADFQLGFVSASYDRETELHPFSDKKVFEDDIKNVLKDFQGKINQKPPMYSAVKIGGKKLYEFAREGETKEVQERTIVINKIELKNFDYENQCGKLLINCSKGTYIRSVIHDMGQKLCTGGVMSGLVRTKSGGMNIENSININDVENVQIAEKNLIEVSSVLDFDVIHVDEYQYQKVKNGNSTDCEHSDGYVFIEYENKIIALGEVLQNTVNMKKVFV